MLLSDTSSPMDDVWVAIDLETTGLSPETDEIIEVGAVKFQGARVLDTFQSFARPERPISRFIQGLTGIEQGDLDRAPAFDAVAGRLAAFVGNTALVGHNLRFDLGFLAHNGLPLRAPRCDTWELAYVLLPRLGEYSLGALARTMVSRTRVRTARSRTRRSRRTSSSGFWRSWRGWTRTRSER